MNKITFEVPNDSAELRKNAFMLGLMADAMDDASLKQEDVTIIGGGDDGAGDIAGAGGAGGAKPDELTVNKTAAIGPTVSIDLDSAGLPWDARIHGSNKAKLAKTKAWKKKRGVDPTLVTTVEAELRATMVAGVTVESEEEPAPAPPAANTIAPPPAVKELTLEETTYKCTDGSIYLGQALLTAGWTVEQITALEVVEAEAPITAVTFPDLMTLITPALVSKTIAESDIIAAVNSVGLTSLPLLAARPDLVGQVKTALFG